MVARRRTAWSLPRSLLLVVAGSAPAAAGQDARLSDRALARCSTQELFELAVQVQRRVQAILLTPDERLVREHAAFLSKPDTGIARLLELDPSSEIALAMPLRGGGAYYSFATREHSYDAEPDLCFHPPRGRESEDAPAPASADRTRGRTPALGAFGSGFYGIQLDRLAHPALLAGGRAARSLRPRAGARRELQLSRATCS